MESKFKIHNTQTRSLEEFVPLDPPRVGLYVCGPTVYGDPHLGHARSAITFDLLFRYLQYSGYKVRYVRNITDVGHLENDADEGEDKISKKARIEQVEPMEISGYYTRRYHQFMDRLNVLRPSIEPLASGHIIEQIEMIKVILDHGYAYLGNGSVYFDVQAYNNDHPYGVLSGRNIEDMISSGRTLDGQSDKRSPLDFALWKKASPEHIMRWPSPWSDGFPGWHMECSAMSAKYLGQRFDIHGGGMDLVFPHHDCEIAQSVAATGHQSARYWMHNNMITMEGRKMGKSLGNAISLEQFLTGDHPLLQQAYSAMTIRFFILQAHYRSTLDFSNEALQAAQKGLERLMEAARTIEKIPVSDASTVDVATLEADFRRAMDDDLNSPIAIAGLFDWVRVINSLRQGDGKITAQDKELLQNAFHVLLTDVLGLVDESETSGKEIVAPLMEMVLEVRKKARENKDWATSDIIRDRLAAVGIQIKDGKDGTEWEIK